MTETSAAPPQRGPCITLRWLPVGASGVVVRRTSRWWERACAARERRPARTLFHAVLEVHTGQQRFVVEMTPTWGTPAPDRGVVAEGPVGARWLGRSRYFRYEVRRWPDGVVQDRSSTVGGLRVLSRDADAAARLLALVLDVPVLVWGRAPVPGTDMWNSNSVVSWLLVGAGVDTVGLVPPAGGRAPGWAAGIVVAALPPDENCRGTKNGPSRRRGAVRLWSQGDSNP